MKHLALFETEADFETAKDSLELPYIAMTEDNKGIHFDFEKPVPVESPLCFTALVDNSSVGLNLQVSKTMFMKLNGGEWQTWDCSTVNLNNGDKLYIKSSDSNPMSIYDPRDGSLVSTFTMEGKIAASGNIMSLLNYTDTMSEYGFWCLFNGCISLTTAPELPATILASNCYYYMFRDCKSLYSAPELPATTLAEDCYLWMFYGCEGLVEAPELPATTLASSCYYGMFENCSSLSIAPELPATTLINGCYNRMFVGCNFLRYVKALFIDWNQYCTANWMDDVHQGVIPATFVKSKDATWPESEVIPAGWTVETV